MTERVLVGYGGPADEVVRYVSGGTIYSEWGEYPTGQVDVYDDASIFKRDQWRHKTRERKLSEDIAPPFAYGGTNNWWGEGSQVLSWLWATTGYGPRNLPRYGISFPQPYLLSGPRIIADDVPDGGVIGACYLDGTLVVATDAAFYTRDEAGEWQELFVPDICGLFATELSAETSAPGIFFSSDGTKAVCTFMANDAETGHAGTRYRSLFTLEKDEDTGDISVNEITDNVDLSGHKAWTWTRDKTKEGGETDYWWCDFESRLYVHDCESSFDYSEYTGTATPIIVAGDYDASGALIDIEFELDTYSYHFTDDRSSTVDLDCPMSIIYTLDEASSTNESKKTWLRMKRGGDVLAEIEQYVKTTSSSAQCAGTAYSTYGALFDGSKQSSGTYRQKDLILTALDARTALIAGVVIDHTWETAYSGPNGSDDRYDTWSIDFTICSETQDASLDLGSGQESSSDPTGDVTCDFCITAPTAGHDEGDGDTFWEYCQYQLYSLPYAIVNRSEDIFITLVRRHEARISAGTRATLSSMVLYGIWDAETQALITLAEIMEEHTGMDWAIVSDDGFDAETRPVTRYALLWRNERVTA